jgi:hypothetical protein
MITEEEANQHGLGAYIRHGQQRELPLATAGEDNE